MKLIQFDTFFLPLIIIALYLLVIQDSSASVNDDSPSTVGDEADPNLTDINNERSSKFVRLNNLQCSANGQLGVCKTQEQCEEDGGITIGGDCGSSGTGVCCFQTVSCPTASNGEPTLVNSSGTHLTHPPMYQAPFQCQFRIPRKNGICQIRLDFVTFNLASPDFYGDCTMDSMTVSGADNLNNFIICGTNTVAQHLYLQYGSSELIFINLSINQATPMSMYDIMVTQIDCGDCSMMSNSNKNNNNDDIGMVVEPAPPGCTQYYTRPSDTVASFNYAQVPQNALDTTQYQINNEQYTVCVKDPSGSNRITWQLCSANDVFSISGPYPPFPPAQASLLPCITDYVDIPGSYLGRYCGSSFPGSVTSMAKPYIMYVNFDAQELYGQNFPIDPATGCPAGFTDCYVGGVIQRPGVAGAMLPCPSFSDNVCIANEFAQAHSDFNNIGFCLRYTVS